MCAESTHTHTGKTVGFHVCADAAGATVPQASVERRGASPACGLLHLGALTKTHTHFVVLSLSTSRDAVRDTMSKHREENQSRDLINNHGNKVVFWLLFHQVYLRGDRTQTINSS